ncbi:MAG: CoA pyrophosphatase [Desulfotomaculaceae bacterium]|nr:CoA pyrophosphatase [Desulfotomaculaceae bacterium]
MDELKRAFRNRLPRFQNEVDFLVSAVLLPIVIVNDEPHVLFEVRAENLKRQPGEICFPGGMVEQSEFDNPMEAAVREATEELGIEREQIEVIGQLDYCISLTGILIYPYVGMIARPDQIVPNPGEVGEVFLVPVKFFLTNEPYHSRVEVSTRFVEGFPFHCIPQSYKKGWQLRGTTTVYFYKYKDRIIWGATAGILHNFVSICHNIKYWQ